MSEKVSAQGRKWGTRLPGARRPPIHKNADAPLGTRVDDLLSRQTVAGKDTPRGSFRGACAPVFASCIRQIYTW